MDSLSENIERHYFKEGLYEEIIQKIEESGLDLKQLTRAELSAVDEFHVRGAAVSKELAAAIPLQGLNVLDIGCGLGGPSRMLAEVYNCQVTGIDLSEEFVRTATALSKLVKLSDKTRFVQGDATALPFEDNAFELVWTQHAQMNIRDKEGFYGEVNRVLKPGGHFLYYDIFKKGAEEISFPVPWASRAELSFLFEEARMKALLEKLGLQQVQATNESAAGLAFFQKLVARLKEFGPPKLGLNVLMGASTKDKLLNVFADLKDGKLEIKSGIYKK